MKVLHLSTSVRGGAGIAAFRLHKLLLDAGVDSTFLSKDKGDVQSYTIDEVYPFSSRSKTILRNYSEKAGIGTTSNAAYSKKYLINKPVGFEYFSFPFSNLFIEEINLVKQADIIHLHWIADDFINYPSFFQAIADKKTVWTLHDMNAFTGGCHHADESIGYKSDCSNCPQLPSAYKHDLAAQMLKIKKEAYSYVKDSIHIVSPSKWLLDQSKHSVFASFPQSVIHNPIDEKTFKPSDKATAKKYFNIPDDKKIALFVSHDVNNARKGIATLLESFKLIPGVELCAVGNNPDPTLVKYSLGYINNEELMARAYNAADVFVLPSVAENFPNTIIESLLCGTPVVASNIGGIPEQVNTINGLTVIPGNPADLAKSISAVINNPLSYSQEIIRKDALSRFNTGESVQQYISLYHKLSGK